MLVSTFEESSNILKLANTLDASWTSLCWRQDVDCPKRLLAAVLANSLDSMYLWCTVGLHQQVSVHHSCHDFRFCVWLTPANAYLHSSIAQVVNDRTCEKYFLVCSSWGSSSVICNSFHWIYSYGFGPSVVISCHVEVACSTATRCNSYNSRFCDCMELYLTTVSYAIRTCSCFIFCKV